MIKVIKRRVSNKEYNQHLKSLNKKGYTILRNYFSSKTISNFLNLTKASYRNLNKKLIKTPKVWNKANIIYNLQNKSIDYLNLIKDNFFEKILINKINDPHYRSAGKKTPNYILNNFIARSSGRGSLFLHIDSGIPTGDVTTFIQIMIPLEETNKETGCTVVVPGSHLSKKFSNRKTKNFDFIYGKPGDVFIWDGNLWHGSLPNITKNQTRWSLIPTFSNWQFKQVFDMPRSLPKSFFIKLNDKQKILLGYCGVPPKNEFDRIPRSMPVSKLKKNLHNLI